MPEGSVFDMSLNQIGFLSLRGEGLQILIVETSPQEGILEISVNTIFVEITVDWKCLKFPTFLFTKLDIYSSLVARLALGRVIRERRFTMGLASAVPTFSGHVPV